jgi:precorrin-2 dehydrogenase/sirohydrochlorin ferrochelatase
LKATMEYFPIFIDLHNKLVLVIGHYRVLEFKVNKLLEAGAKIRYVSDSLSTNTKNFVKSDRITYLQDNFKSKHLDNVWLVICGSDDAELKTRVAQETQQRNILCNFVDEAPISSFISPSVISKGDITIAISTKGKSPALNRYIKSKINENIGDEYKYLAELLGKVRSKVINTITDQKRRSELFDTIVQHPKVLDLIKKNKSEEAEQLTQKLINKAINSQN